MKTPDMKPCPFCGGEAILERKSRTVVHGATRRNTYVRCTQCDSRGRRFLYFEFDPKKQAENEAVNAWNRRVTDENA